MVFWTWAKGLEDKFDGANRRNLRQFISKEVKDDVKYPADSPRLSTNRVIEFDVADAQASTAAEKHESQVEETVQLFLDSGDEKVPLPRMSTMAIFHKLSSGKGVPHTFYGFLKQWPALPRVVVFLSVRIMPTAHVEKEERYRITKVRSLPGEFFVKPRILSRSLK
jgi:KUP system potassium uptake protein